MLNKKSIRIFTILILLLLTLSSCYELNNKDEEPQTKATSYYEYFDTVSVIMSYAGDSKEEFESNCAAVSSLLEYYHRQFDIYYEYAGINNLKTINKNAGKEPVKVDEALIDFLLYCKEMYLLTNGKTNIAMGSVLSIWHDAREFGMENPESAYIPSEVDLDEASKHTEIDKILIDEEDCTVYISDPLMSIDVGAIGKGYATEMAAKLLISKGVSSYVLNIGGNIRAIGEKTNGNGWITGITNPDKNSDENFICKVEIKDISLVTSGDYERYYLVDGKKYHHIIDPDSNMPANLYKSISVFTKDSALADTLSTALFCSEYSDGLELVNKIGDVDVIWVFADGSIEKTDGITICE